MKSGIYKWTSPNGKYYIGQTTNLKRRWRQFRKPNSLYSSKGSAVDNARTKYNDFSKWNYEILEECPEDMLNEREKYYIALFNSTDRSKGYNLTDGGENNSFFKRNPEWSKEHIYERTDEIKAKISKGLKEYYTINNSARATEVTVFKDNKLVETFPSISKAAKALNLDQGHISRSIKRNRLYKGYLFKPGTYNGS